MTNKMGDSGQTVKAFHSRKEVDEDPQFEIGLSQSLRDQYSRDALIELYGRFMAGDGYVDTLMRRAIWRAGALRFGHGIHIGSGVGFKHLETFEIGNGVFIGSQAFIQGRIRGRVHHRRQGVDRSAKLFRRPRPCHRGLCRLGAGGEGPGIGPCGPALGCAHRPD